jgi:hypothetical protein
MTATTPTPYELGIRNCTKFDRSSDAELAVHRLGTRLVMTYTRSRAAEILRKMADAIESGRTPEVL